MTSFVPTSGCLRALDQRGMTWPPVAADLEEHTEVVTPCVGFDTRIRVVARQFQAYCEPLRRPLEAESYLVLGVRPRSRADSPSPAQVVGVDAPAPMRRTHGGRGTRWPTTWQELKDRILEHADTELRTGSKRVLVYHGQTQVAALPIRAGDRRALLNTCQTLRAAGIDVRR